MDSHKRTLAAAAVDELGRSLRAREFPNDPAGHRRMLGWVRTFEGDRRVGVEGSGTYGAGLVRTLVAAGEPSRARSSNLSNVSVSAERPTKTCPGAEGEEDVMDSANTPPQEPCHYAYGPPDATD